MELNISQKIQEKVKLLPQHPGVYMMKDINGKVIYVGKAKRLKNRVKSYFDGTHKTVKTYALVSNVEDFEYILTNSEQDAFSLENTLIKKYKPRYNILLKDDKSFPYIRIDLKERFPRVTVVRRPKNDGALLFGPYVTGFRIREIMDLIKWAYPIRWCSSTFEKGKVKSRPCLHGEIGNCIAPCAYPTREEEYNNTIKDVIAFLNGDNKDIKQRLTKRMNVFAERMQFEEALEIKNLLAVVDKLDMELITDLSKDASIDVFALCESEEITAVNVMRIRAGKNVGQFNYLLEDAVGTKEELVLSFISSFYEDEQPPKEILLQNFMKESDPIILNFLSQKFDKKISVQYPVKGVKKQLIENAEKNASEYANNSRDKYERHKKLTTDALKELAELVGVDSIWRIECFDISNISGTNNVASNVVFEGGEPAKKEYRKFKIKSVQGPNDFACMNEALTRRIESMLEGQKGLEKRPDLIVIDGGLGQLHSAYEAMQRAGADIPMISLAERYEEIYTLNSNKPIALPKSNYALRLLIRIRDEAHRFAVSFHRNLRNGQSLTSFLQEIEGVGKVTSQKIWKHFKTKDAIFNAKPEEFALIDGISEKKAIEIYKNIHKN